MRKIFRILALLASVSALTLSIGLAPAYAADDAKKEDKKEEKKLTPAEEGKKIAFDRKTGNCLACHMIAGGELPGNIGPPLAGVSSRIPDKAKLRAQIYDARVANPDTIMIPFGPMGILSDEEIDKVVEFISTL